MHTDQKEKSVVRLATSVAKHVAQVIYGCSKFLL